MEKRQKIKEAGLLCFSLEGLEGTRVEDITRRAGVAKGTFYYYFNNKMELLDEFLEEFIEKEVEASRKVKKENKDGRDRLKGFIRERFRMFLRKPELFLLLDKLHEMGDFTRLKHLDEKVGRWGEKHIYSILGSIKEEIRTEFRPFLKEIASSLSMSMLTFKEVMLDRLEIETDTEEGYERMKEALLEIDAENLTDTYCRLYIDSIVKE